MLIVISGLLRVFIAPFILDLVLWEGWLLRNHHHNSGSEVASSSALPHIKADHVACRGAIKWDMKEEENKSNIMRSCAVCHYNPEGCIELC